MGPDQIVQKFVLSEFGAGRGGRIEEDDDNQFPPDVLPSAPWWRVRHPRNFVEGRGRSVVSQSRLVVVCPLFTLDRSSQRYSLSP